MTAEILEIFELRLKPQEYDRHADLGCTVDELLGFHSEAPFHSDIDRRLSSSSWMRDRTSFSSRAEHRLQEACVSACLMAADQFQPPDPMPPERVCVRIVYREYGSPYHEKIEGYHFIVVPTGYLAAIENYWRTFQALAVAGEIVTEEKTGAVRRIHSNILGGASIERCLESHAGIWSYLLSDLFNDVIFWNAYDGPFSHPEEASRALARVAYELIAGMYASEGRDLRRPSTETSKRLTRLVLLYVLGHETAHAMLSHEGFEGPDKLTTEKLCDMVATIHTPLFIHGHSDAWDLEIDGAAEYAVGPFGFFTTVEARYLIGKAMDGLGTMGGRRTPDDWDALINDVQTRARGQTEVVKSILAKQAPDVLSRLALVQLEIESALIGVEMLASWLTLKRKRSFAETFDARRLKGRRPF